MSKKETIEREIVKIDDSFEDQTSRGPWEFKGETYDYITESEKFGDGVETSVIVQRRSDEKYFRFCYCYFPNSCGESYEFDTELEEVFPKASVVYE